MAADAKTRREAVVTAAGFGLSALTVSTLEVAAQVVNPQPKRDNLPPPILSSSSGGLRARADAKNLLCGSAVTSKLLARDPQLRNILIQDCNILVPENELKWEVIQPSPDHPLDFSGAEAIYAFAKANNMKMRGHTLTWRQSEPRWAPAVIDALSAAATGDFLENYVTQVVSHWRGRIVQWDVANEPIWINRALSEPLFTKKLSDKYLDIAFQAARHADPAATLVLNHDGTAQATLTDAKQRAALLWLLERLLKRGVPIDALGFEAHLATADGFNEADWRRFLDTITAMGLKIIITEFDIGDAGSAGNIARRDAESAALASAFLDVTLSYPNCLGLLCWGMRDRDSWLHSMSDRQRDDGARLRPTPRDDDYKPKLLWRAIAGAIERARPR